MRTRATLPALALILIAACDGTITGPSFLHLASLSLAPTFSCGIARAGQTYCWGTDNASGQLGTGDNLPTAMPLAVRTGVRFTQVVTGRAHACGLSQEGRAFCWGDNSQSQLGIVTADLPCELLQPSGWTQDLGNACSTLPVPVETSLRFTRLAAAENRTCGLTGGGQLWCWGTGPLGDSAGVYTSDTLVRVSAPARFATFTLGRDHGCAADTDGLGWCWGSNADGSLGLGVAQSTVTYTAAPLRINSSAYLKGLAAGASHTCALTGAGELLCWGAGNVGQRGDSSSAAAQHDPTYAKTSRKFGVIVAAANSSCALELGTEAPFCWGENSSGSLGDGSTFDLLAPTRVLGGLSFTSLAMSGSGNATGTTTCGVTGDQVYCWGLLPQPLTFGE